MTHTTHGTRGVVTACPYPAVATHAGRQVAHSTTTRRETHRDAPPVLWFDVGAVEPEFLATNPDAARHGDGELDGFVAFVDPSVTVQLIDEAGPDERDTTRLTWPVWGDWHDLAAIIDVAPDGDGRWVTDTRPSPNRPVVEASQILGQVVCAAMRQSGGRRAVWATLTSIRVADPNIPLEILLETLTNGRTMTSYAYRVQQNGRTCAAGTVLLDVTAPDVMTHAAPPPECPGPYDCVHHDMSVLGRDLRVADDAYTNDPDAPVGPPVIDAWVRFRPLPADPALHAGLLAQFTGHMSIAAAMRPHAGIGQAQAHRTLSTGINALTIAFHRDVHADHWMLYHHRSTSSSGGMTHSECRVHDEDGALLASFSVEAMVRGFADPNASVDHRRAL